MSLLILGAGGLAREITHVIENDKRINFSQERPYYLSDDESEHGKYRRNGLVVGSIDRFNSWILYSLKNDLDKILHQFIPAVGSPKIKESLVERALAKEWEPFEYIKHKQSFIGDAYIGGGSVVCSMCSITTNVSIGKYVVVNLNCTIGHDVVIEDYVNLSPHCTISGKVTLKKGADLGSAVTVLPGVTIGENSIIGAGAVVNKDIPDNCVAVGIPAKVIREL
jgi:sugar O-acyltransferase (sialic acid O-acetyltransferase NeuD family)